MLGAGGTEPLPDASPSPEMPLLNDPLLSGGRALSAFLPKTKALGSYLPAASGFCGTQNASAPGLGGCWVRMGAARRRAPVPCPPRPVSTAGPRQRREGRERAPRGPTRDGIPRCFPGAGLRKARRLHSRTSICLRPNPHGRIATLYKKPHACTLPWTHAYARLQYRAQIPARSHHWRTEAPLHGTTLPPHGAHPHPAGSPGPQRCGAVRAASPISRPAAAAAPRTAAAERPGAAPLLPGSRDTSAGKNGTEPARGIAAIAGPGDGAASAAGGEQGAEPVPPAPCRRPAPLSAALCGGPVPPRRAGARCPALEARLHTSPRLRVSRDRRSGAVGTAEGGTVPGEGTPRGTPQRMAQPSPPAARGRGHGATGTEQSPSPRPGAWRAARSPGKGPPPAPRAGCSPLLSSSASFLPARPALPLPASLNPFANPAFPEPFVLRSAPGLLSPRPSAHPTALRVQWSPRAAGKASGRCGQRAETRRDGPEQRPRSAHTKAAMALCCAVLCCRAGARRPEERLQGWWQPHNRGLDGE